MPSSYVIGDHFESFIKEQIQQGRYASASEVVRDALRALEDRETYRTATLDALRTEIQRGADSGAGIPAKAVFAAVRKRINESDTADPQLHEMVRKPRPDRAVVMKAANAVLSHSDWLRDKLATSANDPRPRVPHEQVMDEVQALIDSKRQVRAPNPAD